jgi:hypothetical protein
MQLLLKDNLPFTSIVICYQGSSVEISSVLVDTGSASSIFAADIVESVQIVPSPEDIIHVVRGVGGTEVVFKRQVDFIQVGNFNLPDFQIEVGGMDYGFEINGILGMDFLKGSGAIINLTEMKIQFNNR